MDIVARELNIFSHDLVFQVFQLLLPQFKQASNDPLWLLVAMCAAAPFLAWANVLIKKGLKSREPEDAFKPRYTRGLGWSGGQSPLVGS